jgi:hypothetical protein
MDVDKPEDTTHSDRQFVHELTVVNALLSRYVLRYLDAGVEQVGPIAAVDDHALAERLNAAADGIRARAAQRDSAPKRSGRVDGGQV